MPNHAGYTVEGLEMFSRASKSSDDERPAANATGRFYSNLRGTRRCAVFYSVVVAPTSDRVSEAAQDPKRKSNDHQDYADRPKDGYGQ